MGSSGKREEVPGVSSNLFKINNVNSSGRAIRIARDDDDTLPSSASLLEIAHTQCRNSKLLYNNFVENVCRFPGYPLSTLLAIEYVFV